MNDLTKHTELLVIGGGVAGYAAAFRAADLGIDVTVVEESPSLGGVCLLRGCIPSKALLEVAELLIRTRQAGSQGIDFDKPSIDLDRLRQWKNGVIQQLVKGLQGLAEQRNVRIVRGRAKFRNSGEVHIETENDPHEMSFDHAVIATGSRPIALPDTEFSDRIIDSAGALDLRTIPQRLLIVGGGYVGLELGTVYSMLGSRVTLVEMTDRLLAQVDPDLVEPLAKQIQELFDSVHLQTKVTHVDEQDHELRVEFEGEDPPDSKTFDQMLVAIGRRPNTENLGLDQTSVELDERGFIKVDDRRRTTDERIGAIGDVVGGMLLAHEAMHEGGVVAESIARQPASFDARAVPAVVYTDPQIAWCGLTEQAANERGQTVQVTRFPWRASGRALTLGAADGITKLLTDPDSGRVLGLGVVGRQAEALVGQAVIAIEMGAVAEDLAKSIAAHPTVSETIHEAALAALGRPLHLSPQEKS